MRLPEQLVQNPVWISSGHCCCKASGPQEPLSHPGHDLVCMRSLCSMAWLQPHAQAWARRASNMTEHNISNVDITKATTIRSPIPPHGDNGQSKEETTTPGEASCGASSPSCTHTSQCLPVGPHTAPTHRPTLNLTCVSRLHRAPSTARSSSSPAVCEGLSPPPKDPLNATKSF